MRWIFLVLVCSMSLATIGFGLRNGFGKYQLRSHGLPSKGIVVDQIHAVRSNFPVVEFTTDKGQKVRAQINEISGAISNGTTVDIIYDRRDPSRLELAPLSWVVPIVSTLVGAVLFGIGIAGFIFI